MTGLGMDCCQLYYTITLSIVKIIFANRSVSGSGLSTVVLLLLSLPSLLIMGCNVSSVSLQGNSLTDKKLEKANMTQEEWMNLTNRPDVKEKEVIKLLDWFIKVILQYFLALFLQSTKSKLSFHRMV